MSVCVCVERRRWQEGRWLSCSLSLSPSSYSRKKERTASKNASTAEIAKGKMLIVKISATLQSFSVLPKGTLMRRPFVFLSSEMFCTDILIPFSVATKTISLAAHHAHAGKRVTAFHLLSDTAEVSIFKNVFGFLTVIFRCSSSEYLHMSPRSVHHQQRLHRRDSVCSCRSDRLWFGGEHMHPHGLWQQPRLCGRDKRKVCGGEGWRLPRICGIRMCV